MLGDRARVFSKACVELRLSTAGLLAGEIHANAEAAENIHNGFTCLGEERIGQTGDEELDISHKYILIPINLKRKTIQLIFKLDILICKGRALAE